MPPKPQITRDAYPHVTPLPTRWLDNDMYGHVNNVLYYSFFDTAINRYLVSEGGLGHHQESRDCFCCRNAVPIYAPGRLS